MQDTVVHARTSDVLAVCGSLLAAEVPDLTRRHDLSACRHCLSDLSGG
ncbi:hypothetical protein ACFQV2_02145 [Actinokineospora soli]|uniref:Zinc-finger n=1 Tax=Actinokineospora soli TaxID=1048753 RepID=A0ABW2TFU7_9PSEU